MQRMWGGTHVEMAHQINQARAERTMQDQLHQKDCNLNHTRIIFSNGKNGIDPTSENINALRDVVPKALNKFDLGGYRDVVEAWQWSAARLRGCATDAARGTVYDDVSPFTAPVSFTPHPCTPPSQPSWPMPSPHLGP
ncbi:hypothetical protein HDU86_007877 [Geranomyces michiganensis]|nr:hypothetical protein HDU86_007877 [Geranomyces michiganensis]